MERQHRDSGGLQQRGGRQALGLPRAGDGGSAGTLPMQAMTAPQDSSNLMLFNPLIPSSIMGFPFSAQSLIMGSLHGASSAAASRAMPPPLVQAGGASLSSSSGPSFPFTMPPTPPHLFPGFPGSPHPAVLAPGFPAPSLPVADIPGAAHRRGHRGASGMETAGQGKFGSDQLDSTTVIEMAWERLGKIALGIEAAERQFNTWSSQREAAGRTCSPRRQKPLTSGKSVKTDEEAGIISRVPLSVVCFSRALAHNPENPAALARLGRQAMVENQWRLAKNRLSRAAHAQPGLGAPQLSDKKLWMDLGFCNLQLNHLDAACEAYLYSLGDLVPSLSAQAFQAFHACQQARAQLEATAHRGKRRRPEVDVLEDPRVPWHAGGLISGRRRRKRTTPSSTASQGRGGTLQPGMLDPMVTSPLLSTMAFSEEATAAMRCSKQLWASAVSLWGQPDFPMDADLWFGVGLLHARIGDLDLAEAALSAVAAIDPNFEKIHLVRVKLVLLAVAVDGDKERALHVLESILEEHAHERLPSPRALTVPGSATRAVPMTRAPPGFGLPFGDSASFRLPMLGAPSTENRVPRISWDGPRSTMAPTPSFRAKILAEVGHLLEDTGRFAEAQTVYEQVLRLAPDSASVLMQLGWSLYNRQGDFAGALGMLQRAAKSSSGRRDWRTWYLMGRVYMDTPPAPMFEDAYRAYERAIMLDGHNSTIWLSLGVLFFQLQQPRDALNAFIKAARADPSDPQVWYNVGVLYDTSEQRTDAIEAFDRAMNLGARSLDNLAQIRARGVGVRRKSAVQMRL